VEALRVSPAQEEFVTNVPASLLEAAAEPDGRALYWAVYADETPVGFVMISDEVGSPDYIPHYLWNLLIDERFQRRGFGTAALDLVVEYFRGRPGVDDLWTSAGRGERSPSRSRSATASSRPVRSCSTTRSCSGSG
jgi:diamine N-acetyltransferase